MHVAKRMAVLAMMAALSMVLILLGTVIPVNTLFFTAAAAYMTGIAVVLYGKVQGSVYFAVCLSLDFFLNPDKLHVFLFVLFGGYILISEITYRLLTEKRKDRTKERIHRVIRLCLFIAGSFCRGNYFVPVGSCFMVYYGSGGGRCYFLVDL